MLKSNEISSYEKKWRKLKCIYTLNETRESEKATYCMISMIEHSGKGQSAGTLKRCVGRE